jgi:signal transduction histidine kinase
LRSHLLENSNLVTALSEVTKLMAASAHLQIDVQTSGKPRKLAAPLENNLLRIAQEALANTLKHAHASRIAVKLNYGPDRVCLRVCDDGVGFDTTSHATIYGGHFGLLDMSERAEKIGGTFAMISAHGQGTEIVVAVADKGAPEGAVEPEISQDEKASAA